MTEAVKFRRLVLGAAIAFVILAGSITFTRAPYSDEGFFAAPSYTLLHGGFLGCPPTPEFGMDKHVYTIPPVYFLSQAAWYRVVGFGIVRMRLATVLWALVFLIALYSALERATGEKKFALFAVTLLGADYTFLMSSVIGRPDMMSAALGMCSIAAYLRLRDKSLGRAVLVSQTLVVVAGLTQPVGGILSDAVLVGIAIGCDGRRIFRLQYIALAVVPYLFGVAAWGAYILQDPAGFKAQVQAVTLSMDRAQGLHSPIQALVRELTDRYGGYYGPAPGLKGIRVLLPIGYIAGILCVVLAPKLRARRFILILAGIAVSLAFLLAFVDGSKQLQYLVFVIPALVVLLSAVLWYLRAPWPVVALLVLLQVGPALYRVKLDKFHKSFEPAVAALRPIVAAGIETIADFEFAMALDFPDNLKNSIHYGYGTSRRLGALQVEHEVYDGNLPGLAAKDPAEGIFLRKLLTEDFRNVWDDGTYGIYVRR